MFKATIERLSKKPVIFNLLRRIIEFNFITIKKVIRKELALNKPSPDSRRRKILDAPCGTGEFCRLFNPASYVGIDISQEYIDYAKRTYKHTFYCRDICRSGFAENYFDDILILGFFHHLDRADIISTLREIKRILKKDGKVLLIEDAPVNSSWNFIGKFLQRYDLGSNIKHGDKYRGILEKFFSINKYYPIRNGFWNYSVFILSSK